MYGIQDKINQILRGAETIKKNSMDIAIYDTPRVENYLQNFNSQFVPAELARNLERELTKKTNEVARLREENAALKQGKVFVDPKWIYDLETQLAKAHEELCQAGLREYGN